ncbi:leucine-rich repeat domain-containing protein [Hoylesella buccalis]|uniref:leucine-rich repeat domain-containing protein n=1 Tax=Hoylesella buccalis TaxID=28127 RepID=UPI003991EB6E
MSKQLLSHSKLFLISCFLTLGTIAGLAKTVIVDGIKYQYSKQSTYLIVVKAAYSGDIVIPETAKGLPVKAVGPSAFSGLDELVSVTLPNSIVIIGNYAFDSSTNLKKVVLGNSVRQIGHWSFRNCYQLQEVEFPKSLKTIGNYCFDKNLKFTKVTIPENVTLIGGYAFEGNPQLTTVYSLSQTPPEIKKGYIDGEVVYTLFDDENYGERVLYVPQGTVDAYKLTFGWNHFKYIKEITPTAIRNLTAGLKTHAYSDTRDQLVVVSTEKTVVNVYDLAGKKIITQPMNAGIMRFNVPSGVVIVNGQKVLIK